MSSRTVSEVKAKLSEYIRAAEHGDPVVITRHGQAVAALVGPDQLQRLQLLRAAGPAAGLASVAGGWTDSDELVRILETSSRAGSRSRGAGTRSGCGASWPS
jgi:prevent-host-death family protein